MIINIKDRDVYNHRGEANLVKRFAFLPIPNSDSTKFAWLRFCLVYRACADIGKYSFKLGWRNIFFIESKEQRDEIKSRKVNRNWDIKYCDDNFKFREPRLKFTIKM
jgi:hypothetical protein